MTSTLPTENVAPPPTHSSYLVQYGRAAFVGRFPADLPFGCGRGDRVLLRGPRGPELGTVLCRTDDRFGRSIAEGGGLLRLATPDDEERADRLERRGLELLASAQERAVEMGLSLSLIDSEVSFDERTADLHGLPWGECDATALFEELSARFGLTVRLLDLSRQPTAADEPPPASSGGCGSGGCGTGGGCSSCSTSSGCSTGSCSKNKVKSAGELTAYFADLRRQMEDDTARRTPLV